MARHTTRRYHEMQDRTRSRRARALGVSTVVVGLLYLPWAIAHVNPHHPWIGALYVLFEAYGLLLFTISLVLLWQLRFKPAAGQPPSRPVAVDVLLPTCNEPLHVIATTMAAVRRLRWSGPLAVYVLDDGGQPAVRALAERHGFHYQSRVDEGAPRQDAKAGNLNFGLSHSCGEYVLVLDADQVPRPDLLVRLAGYLEFERVAFVQSSQQYLTTEGDPFYASSTVFYGAVQLGLDGCDSALSCGTGVLYRREALEEVGGFASWNIVEDLTTFYELHAHRWRSFYYDHPLSRGLSPTSPWAVYQQRGQWVVDAMRLFLWDNPWLKRGLRLRQRVQYSAVPMAYVFFGFVLPGFFLLPLWTYLTGETVLSTATWDFLLFRGSYVLMMIAAIRYQAGDKEPAKQFRVLAGLMPVFAWGVLRALLLPRNRHKPRYRANNASPRSRREFPVLLAVLPQLALMAPHLVWPMLALRAGDIDPVALAINVAVSAFSIWCLSYVVIAALSRERWPASDRPSAVYTRPPPAGVPDQQQHTRPTTLADRRIRHTGPRKQAASR